jgi:hypothetical protein
MPRHIYAAIAALTLLSGTAAAQTATYPDAPAAPPPPAMSPPPAALSVTRESHAADSYGNSTDSRSTVYRDSQGVASDKTTTTTTVAPPPPPPPVTSSTTTTTQTTTAPQ